MTICRRYLPVALRGLQLHKRADKLPEIGGTAAVYFDQNNRAGTQYQLWSDVFERISPGAFDKAVGRDDVRGLQNHDPRMLLGRSSAGTLTLSLEKHGLDYRIDTPDTQAGRDSVVSLERQDMTGSSFSFRVEAGGQEWSEEKSVDGVILYVRTIKAVELYDVGPVTFPAYSATSAGTRCERSPGIFAADSRSADAAAEVAELRSSLERFIRQNNYEPEARERLIRLAECGR